jgi:3-hydroxy-3-methylglutaryl CoA synthase
MVLLSAGAVVFIIGPNAPLVLERVRASCMRHTWDFYKARAAHHSGRTV